jgi:mRNA-degrading endonuclease RelE of RelBE toxin-antitoxin system
MVEILATQEFTKFYKDLPASIKNKADKKTKLFRENPFYPSLSYRKAQSKSQKGMEFSR